MPIQSLRDRLARALQVDDGEIGVIALRDPALAGDAEDALRPGAGQVDEALQAQPAGGHMVSITGTRVCTPGMPEGEAG